MGTDVLHQYIDDDGRFVSEGPWLERARYFVAAYIYYYIGPGALWLPRWWRRATWVLLDWLAPDDMLEDW